MSGFFEELKRRKVYRVAIAYVIASWALAQGLAQVLPVFDIPNSAIRSVIALMLIGFPVALVLAWVFDVTPQGIRTTSTPGVPVARRRRNLIILIALGVVISVGTGFFLLPRASARKIDNHGRLMTSPICLAENGAIPGSHTNNLPPYSNETGSANG